jgi:hypothetical protein
MTVQGTEHSVTIGRFQEANLHWPVSGDESEETAVGWVPGTVT